MANTKRVVINTTEEVLNAVRRYLNSHPNSQGVLRTQGEFVAAAVRYLSENHIDIWEEDPDAVPYKEVQEPSSQIATIESNNPLIQLLQNIANNMNPADLVRTGIELGQLRAEVAKCEEVNKQLSDASEHDRKQSEELLQMLQAAQSKTADLEKELARWQNYGKKCSAEFERLRGCSSWLHRIEVNEPIKPNL